MWVILHSTNMNLFKLRYSTDRYWIFWATQDSLIILIEINEPNNSSSVLDVIYLVFDTYVVFVILRLCFIDFIEMFLIVSFDYVVLSFALFFMFVLKKYLFILCICQLKTLWRQTLSLGRPRGLKACYIY